MQDSKCMSATSTGPKNSLGTAIAPVAEPGVDLDLGVTLERILSRVPPIMSLPPAKGRCPWTGQSRTGLLELVAPCERNGFKPPVPKRGRHQGNAGSYPRRATPQNRAFGSCHRRRGPALLASGRWVFLLVSLSLNQTTSAPPDSLAGCSQNPLIFPRREFTHFQPFTKHRISEHPTP